ncbi:MAG: hypothetical protein EBQ86_07985 [Betaproteobacteria bacterium]|nr:hypothetical protein [Betaproteobacteria bacterium]
MHQCFAAGFAAAAGAIRHTIFPDDDLNSYLVQLGSPPPLPPASEPPLILCCGISETGAACPLSSAFFASEDALALNATINIKNNRYFILTF